MGIQPERIAIDIVDGTTTTNTIVTLSCGAIVRFFPIYFCNAYLITLGLQAYTHLLIDSASCTLY